MARLWPYTASSKGRKGATGILLSTLLWIIELEYWVRAREEGGMEEVRPISPSLGDTPGGKI